jgi:hypothetical protein
MLRIRETIKIDGWTVTLVASKCVLGGDWEISARNISSESLARADWYSKDRHASGVKALDAGRAWAAAELK